MALPTGGREQTLVVGKSVSPSYFVSVAPPPPRHLERYLAIILGNLLFVAFKYKMFRLRAQVESRTLCASSFAPLPGSSEVVSLSALVLALETLLRRELPNTDITPTSPPGRGCLARPS